MNIFVNILKKCPLFDNIETEDFALMLHCLGARVENFKKKDYILSEGESATSIGILLSGRAQIDQVDYFGNRTILTDLVPSEMMGESFACASVEALPVNVIAMEDSSVLFIEWNRIIHPCSNGCGFHKQLVYNLMHIIASKNVIFHHKLGILSKRTTREKLLAFLTLQAKRNNSNQFTIPYDRQQLADYLQVERSGLSAEISKLRKEGIIESTKNHFIILKDLYEA